MFCGNCGNKLKEGASFCPKCGNKIAVEQNSKSNKNVTAPAKGNKVQNKAQTNTPQNPATNKKPINKKQLILWLSIGGGVLLIIIAAIIAFIIISNNNTENKLREALASSWITQYGVVSNSYVKDSEYYVEECKYKSVDNSGKQSKFYFSGIVCNDNFRSEIEGYALGNSDLSIVDDFKVEHKNTIPLKGVDNFFDPNKDSSSTTKRAGSDLGNGFTLSWGYEGTYERSVSSRNVTSTLNENNGNYTSEATGEQVISYWFVDDIADAKAKFKFSSNNGWERDGDVSLSNKRSEYKTNGKTFKYSKADDSKGPKEYLITLGEVKDGILTFSYSLNFTPKREKVGEGDTYRDIIESGTVSGKIAHDWDNYKFSCEGTCSSNSQIHMAIEYNATRAKHMDEKYDGMLLMDVDIKSDIKYYYNTKWSIFYITYEEPTLEFEEQK